jgi:fibronectin type 3 domain-containing protein
MKTSLQSLVKILGLSALIILPGCATEPAAPPVFDSEPFPAAPTRVNAVVDSISIKLTWSYDDSTPAARFNIYRQSSVDPSMALLGTSALRQFTDGRNLVQNREYAYSVSAVLANGMEGPRSEPLFTVFAPGGLPSEVFLLTPVALDTFPVAVRLSWAVSPDTNNFAAYQIYRSKTQVVDFNTTPVATITSRTQLTYVDSGLQSGTVYYYRLFVFNRAGRSSASNVVMAQTPADGPPSAVTLAQPSYLDSSGLRLTWTRSRDGDFASYRVFRSTASPVNVNGLPLAIINDAQTTTYDDRGLSRGVVYYYVISVFDRAGQSTKGNEVSGKVQ